jgi:predicted nucleic acid-binding protein
MPAEMLSLQQLAAATRSASDASQETLKRCKDVVEQAMNTWQLAVSAAEKARVDSVWLDVLAGAAEAAATAAAVSADMEAGTEPEDHM